MLEAAPGRNSGSAKAQAASRLLERNGKGALAGMGIGPPALDLSFPVELEVEEGRAKPRPKMKAKDAAARPGINGRPSLGIDGRPSLGSEGRPSLGGGIGAAALAAHSVSVKWAPPSEDSSPRGNEDTFADLEDERVKLADLDDDLQLRSLGRR